jgi:WD40 repeat protein
MLEPTHAKPPSTREHVPPDAAAQLAGRLLDDQRARWERGERLLVETYVDQHPDLAAAPDAILDLIYQEIVLRKQAGEEPALPEYQGRFPQWAGPLRELFEVDSALDAGSLPDLATTHDSPGVGPGTEGRPVPATTDEVPSVPGYDILGELGRGRWGVVYRARHQQLSRVVALKMILAGSHAGAQELARFDTEASAVARLQHPNIVQIYHQGRHAGLPYLELEYVDGGSLEQFTGTPQPVERAASLVEALARAVHYAHQQGIVHRDLKPANVLLTAGGIPKITDFGLAKLLTGDEAAKTRTGDIAGTPGYMAPEQAAGRTKEAGTAADVYSLGAILYDLLTGRPPFKAETWLETLRQVVAEEPVAPRRLRPKLPRDLETVCLKCLQKEPSKRYPSALELAKDLRRFLAGEPIKARPVGHAERLWRWARRNSALAGLSAAVFLLLLTVAIASTVAAVRIAAARDDARDRAREAEEAKEREAQEHRQAVEKLVRLYVNTGMRLAGEEGDVLGALPWLAEAFRLEPGGPEREMMHRFRLASVLEQRPRLVQLWRHPDRVTSAEYSPDGRRVLTACADGFARVWDLATGRVVTLPLRHSSEVLQATFSPDGHRILTAGADDTARVWDAATGQALTPPLRHRSRVTCVAFSPDGRRVLTASADGTARVWDAATGKGVTPPLPHSCQVLHAAFSPDGRRVVTACGKGFDGIRHLEGWGTNTLPELANLGLSEERRFGHARVWDAETGKPLTPFLKDLWDSTDQVLYACFSPDSRLVLTVHAHDFAQIWDAATGKRVGPTFRHPGVVIYGRFSPDGRRVVTACRNAVRLWDAGTGQLLTPPLRHAGEVYHASFSPDGRRILSASDDMTVRLWDAGSGEPVGAPVRPCTYVVPRPSFSPDGRQVMTAHGWNVQVWEMASDVPGHLFLRHSWSTLHAAFSPDGGRVVTASNDKTARVWEAATGQAISLPLWHGSEVIEAAFRPDGRVVTVDRSGTGRAWDAMTGEQVAPPLPLGRKVAQASFDRDARRVVTVGTDTTAGVWDLATGKYVPLRGHAGVLSASFSPDGRLLVTAGNDKTARVWDAATGQPRIPPLQHTAPVAWAAFSPDGGRVITASDHLTTRVWDAATGRALSPPLVHALAVVWAAFSPDGQRVVTASADRTARVWDAATGQPLTPPLVHSGRVSEATFSPDGRRLATACWDGTARVWDAATGEPVSVPLRHASSPLHVTFSPNGRQLLTAGWDWGARLWNLPREDRSPEELLLLAEVLSGYRIDATGGPAAIGGEDLQRTWEQLRAKYPNDFAPAAKPGNENGDVRDYLRR